MKILFINTILIFFSLQIIVASSLPSSSVAQGITITGTITDMEGETMPGVNVTMIGANIGTVSDVNGRYSITVPDQYATLLFTFVGYVNREHPVGNLSVIDIMLTEDTMYIEEVVVVGYGTQKKVNLTGAVEAVGSEVFENRSLSNTTQALQGAIPNLNIVMEDGKPSRSATFNVRGATSIGSGGSALILIDGVEGDPGMLNPNDIESVSVLKDAASAAIYGSRGAFGVILITTKRPQKGKATINYTGNYSFQSPTRVPDMINDAVESVEYFRESFYARSLTIPASIYSENVQLYSDAWLDRLRAWKASGEGPKTVVLPDGRYEYYCNTDWYKLLYKDRAFVQDHNFSVSGGNDRADFHVSARVYDFDGLFNFNADTYRSYNIRAKGGLQVLDWLRVTNNMEYAFTDYHYPSTQNRPAQHYIYRYTPPSVPLFNPDGTYSYVSSFHLSSMIEGNDYDDMKSILFSNNFGFSADFFDKKFRVNGDLTIQQRNNSLFRKRSKTPTSNYQGIIEYAGDLNGTIHESMAITLYTAANMYAEYENTFGGDHYVKGMIGYGYETQGYRYNDITRNGLLLDGAESVALAVGESIVPGASVSNWRVVGSFFRLNYGYKNRYLIELNGRYDGSSKFPVSQQFGFFPSISGGWRLSEEPFWNMNKNILSDVKFRASYGSLGNGNVNPYSYLELLNITTSGRVLNGNKNKQTSVPSPIPAGLTWEKATTTNFGIDFGMLQRKFLFSGDYYVRKTTDMFTVGVTLPDVFGASSPKGNYADMTTKGWEITLSYRDKFTLGGKPFNFLVKGSLWDYYTKVDRYNNSLKALNDYYEGMTIGEVWGFVSDGLFQSDASPTEYRNTLMSSPTSGGIWLAGDLKIRSLSGRTAENGAVLINIGDNTFDDPGDRTVIGNTQPRYQYSLTLNAEWNNFYVSAFFMGVGKQDLFLAQDTPFFGKYHRPYAQMPKWHVGNMWSEDNRDAYLPRLVNYNQTMKYSNNYDVDRWKQNVSYFRLKNLTIGYNLPNRFISVVGMQQARIYISGENIFCWSPLYKRTKDFDVLTLQSHTDSHITSGTHGYGNTYPLLKTYSLGLSLTF